MHKFNLFLLLLALFLTKACYPVSHVIVGEAQTPIHFNDVKVYIDYPDNYEKIAIIESSSDLAFKDFSIDITHQQKTNKALERIKREAASLGANGVVIQNISTNIRQHFNLNENDRGELSASSFNEKHKELNAVAIYVN